MRHAAGNGSQNTKATDGPRPRHKDKPKRPTCQIGTQGSDHRHAAFDYRLHLIASKLVGELPVILPGQNQ